MSLETVSGWATVPAVTDGTEQCLREQRQDVRDQEPPCSCGGGDCLAVVTAAAPALAFGGHGESSTLTPIKDLVVIFQENVSFDHYFATYPSAANAAGEPRFTELKGTPAVNGLNTALWAPNNPNSMQPFRLGRNQAQTCDQDHSYTDQQKAFDSGLMDKFVETAGRGGTTCVGYGKGNGLVMGYYDGSTVTGLWNYAQHFAMSDNSYGTTFGPSTPGALNLIAGQIHGFATTSSAVTSNTTVIGDPQPTGDKCDTRDTTTSTDPRTRTSVTCSRPRPSRGAGSRAASPTVLLFTATSAGCPTRTTSLTTSPSSTTRAPRTRSSPRPHRLPRSATAAR